MATERSLNADGVLAPLRGATANGYGWVSRTPRHGLTVNVVNTLRVALLLLVVTNVGRIPLDLGAREAPLMVNDIAALAVLAVGGLAMLRAKSVWLTDVAMSGIVFASIGALSAVAAIPRFGLTPPELVASLAYLARWVVYFAIYIVVVNCADEEDAMPLWRAIEAAMLVFAAFGVFQAMFLPNFGLMVYPEARPYLDIDPQGQRLVSTVLEPNIAAAMIVLVLLVQVSMLATGVPVPTWKPALMFFALLLTISRSGAFSFVIGLLFILATMRLRKRVLKLATLAAVIVVATIPLVWDFVQAHGRLGITDNSAYNRVIMWGRAITTFLEHPWFGIGFNTYGFVQERRGFERVGGASYSVEGGLLFVAVMTGIVGLTVFCYMLWRAVRRAPRIWRDARATPEQRGLAVGTAAATLAVCIHSVFVNSLMVPFVMEPLWVLWGLIFLIARSLRLQREGAG